MIDKFHSYKKFKLLKIFEQKIRSDDRIIMTSHMKIDFRPVRTQTVSHKPTGLWYSFGTEWIEWVKYNMPDWEEDYLFRIEVNPKVILQLEDQSDIEDFEKEYGKSWSSWMGKNKPQEIDWPSVARKWSGIELMDTWDRGSWRYGWDVASGCIWDKRGIKKIERIK